MTTDWPSLFANPELTAAALLPLVPICLANTMDGIPKPWYTPEAIRRAGEVEGR
jgi:hypothetical protein